MYEHLGCSMSLAVFVLIYTPLVTSDFEHIVVCLLTICIFSFAKCLFKSFTHIFSFGLFVFLLNCIHFLCILDTSLLSDTCIANIFFFSLGSSLNFLKVILWWEEVFIFEAVNSFLCVSSMKHLSTPRSQRGSMFLKGFYKF